MEQATMTHGRMECVIPPAARGKASHQNPIDIRDNGAEEISTSGCLILRRGVLFHMQAVVVIDAAAA